ncbi:hypothetical protein KP509_12G072600 [Ceratopteris richardii]|uniref:Uncharacterized protein n=1 Tax=Ceratopteris richardii TaxID=49495 RepID=A0A8T2TMQ2_CERRI|nr:hypothetical protein KP509_12G072600 [Ceratopteris richardii]KAH7423768.1 hypothetical protein KP509_12G072600 [Ceratopteris richardii]
MAEKIHDNDWEILCTTKVHKHYAPMQEQEVYSCDEGFVELEEHHDEDKDIHSLSPDQNVVDQRRIVSSVDAVKNEKNASSSKCEIQPKKSDTWNTALPFMMMLAIVGSAVLGHQWYRRHEANQQLRLELSSKNEKSNRVMHRIKDVLSGQKKGKNLIFWGSQFKD